MDEVGGFGSNRQAIRSLGRDLPLRFHIVGDGAARPRLAQLAEETNAEIGRQAVVLTGMLLDPRPAYAAADIVVGMGGSSLRGIAFGKPVIIVGEKGFSAPFTPGRLQTRSTIGACMAVGRAIRATTV